MGKKNRKFRKTFGQKKEGGICYKTNKPEKVKRKTCSRSQVYYTTFFKKIKRQCLLNIYNSTGSNLCKLHKEGEMFVGNAETEAKNTVVASYFI